MMCISRYVDLSGSKNNPSNVKADSCSISMLGKSLLSFSGKYRTHRLTAERWSEDTASGFRCLNVEQNNRKLLELEALVFGFFSFSISILS